MTPDEASAKLHEIDNVLKEINGKISAALNNPLISMLPFVPVVLNTIHGMVADVSHVIEGIVGHIVAQIVSTISNAVPTAVDFLIGISNDIFKDVHDVLGNLATAEEFVGGAINEIKKHAGDAAGFFLGAIGGGISGGFIEVLKFLEGQDRNTVDHFLDEVLKGLPKGHWLTTMVEGLRGRGAEWQALALPLLVGVMLQPIGVAMADPLIKDIAYASNEIFKSEMRSPADLIEARMKNIINEQTFLLEMSRNNINDRRAIEMLEARRARLHPDELARLSFRGQLDEETWLNQSYEAGGTVGLIQLQREAMRPLLSEDEIRQTFLRGIIDRPKHDALMAQHGYTQERINQKVNLYYLIPGPQDLIHMGIRNVFDPEIVQTFELGKDAPPQFFAAAAQQGISTDWADKYWQAHWIVPGEDQAFRMYQRTLDAPIDVNADEIRLLDGKIVYNIIGRKTLELFLKDKDVPPYYREKMTEIAYHPLNRIDIRRMRIVGALTQAQVQRAYLDLGYSLHNATLLSDFVEKLAAQTRKDKAQPFVDGLRRQILTMYVNEKLELSDAAFALDDIGFTKEEADHYLNEAKLIQQAEDALQVEAGIGRLYVSNFITEDDTRTRLGNALVPAKAIDRLIRKWNLQRELRQDTEHFHKMRDLTKAEVTEAYADKLMSKADAESFLGQLGYPVNEADIVLSLADYKAARATRTAMQEAVKAAYVAGIRELVPTSNMLDALGLPSDRRDALLTEWKLLRETRTEKIPIATLRDLVKVGRLTRDDAFAHLKRHRYTDVDANIMLDLWLGVQT